MTIEEKIGQLNQYSGDKRATGPLSVRSDLRQRIRAGEVGSMLNVVGAAYTRGYQEEAMASRLQIPLLFALDVINGYMTHFPIPLAEAASFDLAAIERSARLAATEAAAAGIHWTFAPMVDVARDPRWGRVMEGAGECSFLASKIAAARVRGFQGSAPGALDAVLATAKHFAAYGAATGGRDYNAVDMSERQLRETYLPPFKAARDAGAATFMNAFNDLNGVPASGHRGLLRGILKGEWGFEGVVVSDWASIGEMVPHGHARDAREAALRALTAGTDVDMESNAYREHLAALVAEGAVPMALLDDAVRRVLRLKHRLGLFDDPFRFCDEAREQAALGHIVHRNAARDMARRSVVLLKNEAHAALQGRPALPLSPRLKTVALVGPLADAVIDHHGAWRVDLPELDYAGFITTQFEGLRQRLPQATRLLHAKGCEVEGDSREGFAAALAAAAEADVVIASVGEHAGLSGEARSRSRLGLPGVQEELLRALHDTGKPLVVVINAGRPLVIPWVADHASAVVMAWWLGTEAGGALADVLSGDHNPAARLPMTFPRAEGQIPIHHDHFSTGRPVQPDNPQAYATGYIDLPQTPQWAFGHGLSYTTFAYSALVLDRPALRRGETLTARFTLANTGARAGEEVVQLYLRDLAASVVRPVKQLRGWQQVPLEHGEQREVAFTIDTESLSFFDDQLRWGAEAGEFVLMIGAASDDIRLEARFELLDGGLGGV